jgi:ABC-type uncharacterized transport system substrate-binding protein
MKTAIGKVICLALSALPFALCFPVRAQQVGKVLRIGYLIQGAGSEPSRQAFRQGLHELGYVEGKNIAIEYRNAEGKLDRLYEIAAELVRLKVEVIVVAGTNPAAAARQATNTIPIVVRRAGDLVEAGLVASLARPGGNVTGLSGLGPELSGKKLELLKEAFPKVSRIAVLWNPTNASNAISWRETQTAGRSLSVQLQSLEIRAASDFDGAFGAATREHADALLVTRDSITNNSRRQIVVFAAKNRLPAMYPTREYVEDGGLMAYGPDYLDMDRRSAWYVDKILKGAKPADLPVEQPTKFELIINLKAVKQIGLAISPNVLARADKVIR